MEHLLPIKLNMLRKRYQSVTRNFLAIDNSIACILNLKDAIKRLDISLEIIEADKYYKHAINKDLNLLAACLYNTSNTLEKIKDKSCS